MKNFTSALVTCLAFLFSINTTVIAQDCAPAINSMQEVIEEYAGKWNTCLQEKHTISGQLSNANYMSNYYEEEYLDAYQELNTANSTISSLQNQINSLQSQLNSISADDGITQADVDAAYANGAASVTPEDGVNQSHVDAAYANGAASVTPEDGVNQSHVDAAYANGAASVTPEDGVNQSHVDAAYANGAASVTPEDGVHQSHVDAVTPLSLDMPMNLPNGWSMFGYTCVQPLDVIDGFVSVKESLEIVKDEMGLAYLPDYNFNAIGDLKHGEGYQIKLTNSIEDFQFCKTLVAKVFGCTDANAFNYMPEANTEDDSCIPVLTGCMDEGAFNFDAAANTDDDSCIAKVFGCTNSAATNYEDVANTDDSSCIILGCIDEAAFNYDVSANTNDGSCVAKVLGCTNSSALNYDASANTNDDTCLEIGSSFEGGVIFYLDGNGGALIAAPSDQSTSAIWGCPGTLIGTSSEVGSGSQNTLNMVAGCTASGGHGPKAANICSELTLGGYNDWYLPSVDELALIEQNISGLNTSYPNFYWSSTEYDSDKASQYVGGGGYINNNGKQWTGVVRAIRSVSLGCTDPSASNYNASATTDDASCIVECVLPAFMTSASDFESPSITSGEVLYVYYDNTYITHFTTSSSSIVTGSTPGYSGNGPRYSDEDYGTGAVQPGVNYYAGTLSSLTSINEANYPYWVGAGDEYIFDTRSFENGGETYDGVGNFSWTNWTNKNLKISKTQVVCDE